MSPEAGRVPYSAAIGVHTYQAGLSSKGVLSKVGTVTPTCAAATTVISWNSQGPQGDIGPQGPQGAQGAQGPIGNAGPSGVAVCSGYRHVGIDLSACDLEAAFLASSNLSSGNLSGANLTNANPNDTILTNASLFEANLTDATVLGVTWSNTTCPDGTDSSASSPQTCRGHGRGL